MPLIMHASLRELGAIYASDYLSSGPSSHLQIEIAAGPVCEESLRSEFAPGTCQLTAREQEICAQRFVAAN